MMGTNCSYTPILMLVLPEHLQPLSKGLCLFLGQPQSCVLVRPRSSQLAQSGGWGDRRRRWWHRRDKACDKRCQCRTCCSICPSQVPFTHHSPLPLPGSLEGNSLQFAWTAGIFFFFLHLVQSFQCCISAWMKCVFSQLFTVLLWNLCSHPSTELCNSLLCLPTVSTLLWPFNQGTWLLSGRHMP